LTIDVLKLDKSKEFNEEHSENILFISITEEVLNLDIFIEFNEEHLLNI
jgi:hypothetical protein